MQISSRAHRLRVRALSAIPWILILKDVVRWIWNGLKALFNLRDFMDLMSDLKEVQVLDLATTFLDRFGWVIGLIWLTAIVFWPEKSQATPKKAEEDPGERDQVLHSERIRVTARFHPGGILIEVKQILDRQRAMYCDVFLTDLKQIKDGQACVVADIHDANGGFRYGRVYLRHASNHRELFYDTPQSWWLVSTNTTKRGIHYAWGEKGKGGNGVIPIQSGIWLATVEVQVETQKIVTDVRFQWDAFGPVRLVEPSL